MFGFLLGELKLFLDWLNPLTWESADFKLSPKSGTQELIRLIGIIITQIVALVVFAYGKPKLELWIIGFYLLIAAVPLLAIAGMLRLRQHVPYGDNSKRHAFDRGTIMFGHWSLFASALVIATAAYSAAYGYLPGMYREQSLQVLKEAKVESWKEAKPLSQVKKEDDGVIVDVVLTADQFRALGSPSPLTIEVELVGSTADGWQIVQATTLEANGRMETDDTPASIPLENPHQRRFLVSRLKAGVDYIFQIKLHRYAAGETPNALVNLIAQNPKACVKATAYGPK